MADTPTPDTGGNPRPPAAPETHCAKVQHAADALRAKGFPYDMIADLLLKATGCE